MFGIVNTDCRSEEGVTVGLIDALITISRILVNRNLESEEVIEALKDLSQDENVRTILNFPMRGRSNGTYP